MKFWQPIALAGIMTLATAGVALSLDAADILNMVHNNVAENVIVNVVRNRGLTRFPTANEIVDLHQAGASAELLSFLTSQTAPGVTGPTPTVVVSDPVPCSPCIEEPPLVVQKQPVVVYETAPVVVPRYPNYVYDPWPYRYHPNFYFAWDHWSGPRYRGRPHRPPPHRFGRPGGGPRHGRPGGPPRGGPGRRPRR